MLLEDYLKDKKKGVCLLWFEKFYDLCSENYTNYKKIPKKFLKMKVMDTEEEEEYTLVWLK